jgi:hypothetical protein
VEVGEEEARATRTERTPFRRNLRRPTVAPPSIHMVRPVRNIFISPLFLVSYEAKKSLQNPVINYFFIIFQTVLFFHFLFNEITGCLFLYFSEIYFSS